MRDTWEQNVVAEGRLLATQSLNLRGGYAFLTLNRAGGALDELAMLIFAKETERYESRLRIKILF
jgi:hypothetical protein